MFKEGSTLNEFLLIDKLGSGYFGQVWLAENQVAVGDDPKRVALKIPFHQDEGILSEGQALASLGHPNIVKFYRPGRTNDGLIFLVMEYMPGGNLSSRLKDNNGKLAEEEAVEIAVQILHGLEYVHGKGYAHMDIKPQNILFDAAGKAKLADFGLAKIIGSKGYISDTSGTPAYMAPEAWNAKTCIASDLWSVGIVLHEMLTGELPFQASTPEHLMFKILSEPPTLFPDLNDEMKDIILKALEKDMQNRYSTVSAMINALESARVYVNLDEAWMKKYDLLKNKDTILIIVGKLYQVELDDRPGASLVQAELIRSGRMAIILTDEEYLERRETFANHPLISIGGPMSNKVTHELNQIFEIDEDFYKRPGQKVVKVDPSPPAKAVAWGGWAQDTLRAVVEFIRNDLSHFLKPDVKANKIVLSPHIDDAFLFLSGCIVNWRREDKTVKVLDVFSSTNFSSFYVSSRDPQQISVISNFRKIEELTNALTEGVHVVFLDFPDGLLRNNCFSMNNIGCLWENKAIRDIERPLVEDIIKAIPLDPDIEYYFPLGLSEHVDHLLVRTIGIELIKEGKIKKGYFYEDIWPFLPNIEREFARKDIQDIPPYITEMMKQFNIYLRPHWMEINIKEALDMAAVYFSEVEDMKNMLSILRKYHRSNNDGRYYARYWERVNHPPCEILT